MLRRSGNPAVRRPASRSCAASAFPARRCGRGAWRIPGFRRDPARGALTGARGRGAPGSPAPARKTDSNERTDAGTRIRTGTAARATTGPRSAGSPPTPGWRGRDRGSAGRGSGDADVAVAVDRLPPGWGRAGGARRTRDAVNRLPRERERAPGGERLRHCAADFPGAETRGGPGPGGHRSPPRQEPRLEIPRLFRFGEKYSIPLLKNLFGCPLNKFRGAEPLARGFDESRRQFFVKYRFFP